MSSNSTHRAKAAGLLAQCDETMEQLRRDLATLKPSAFDQTMAVLQVKAMQAQAHATLALGREA